MRYSDDVIEEVRTKNDIVDVVSQYVKLTRKGSSYSVSYTHLTLPTIRLV